MAGNQNSVDAMNAVNHDTRFGGSRANPHVSTVSGANKPGSIRSAIRHIAGQDIELPENFFEMKQADLAKLMLPKKPKPAQVVAAMRLAGAMLTGGGDGIIEQTDGKLPQVNVNAEFAELLGMSDDELLAIASGAAVPTNADDADENGSCGGDPAATSGTAPAPEGTAGVTTAS